MVELTQEKEKHIKAGTVLWNAKIKKCYITTNYATRSKNIYIAEYRHSVHHDTGCILTQCTCSKMSIVVRPEGIWFIPSEEELVQLTLGMTVL